MTTRLNSMTTAIKIFSAACCFTTGCILTGISGDMPFDISWLNPVCLSMGFLLTMSAGLYGFLKLVKPLLVSQA